MSDTAKSANRGFIAAIERVGNRLPDPVFYLRLADLPS